MVSKDILEKAVALYLQEAYGTGGTIPASALLKRDALAAMPTDVPDSFFEPAPALAGNAMALRLGQPMYPHMKLVVEFCGAGQGASGAMFRVDTHDKHLHAPPGSPDEVWLQKLRNSNKEVTERIEAAWAAAGVPTFKGFLRRQLEERKKKAAAAE